MTVTERGPFVGQIFINWKCALDGVVVVHMRKQLNTDQPDALIVAVDMPDDPHEPCIECKLRLGHIIEGAFGDIPGEEYAEATKSQN